MKREIATKIKAKVSNKVAISAITIISLISLSLVVASLVTPSGVGNFYSGSAVTLPPLKPVCPAGDYIYDNGKQYYYYCEDDGKTRYCEVDLDDQYRCVDFSGNTNNDEACCKDEVVGCPPSTTKCGDACCTSKQSCESSWGVKYCDNVTCPAGKERKTCGKDRAACCNPGDGCGIKSILGTKISICIPPDPPGGCNSDSPGYCGKTDDDKTVCCGPGTKCKNDDDSRNTPVCVPLECEEGEKLCSGDLGFALCCKGSCYRQGPDRDHNGIPDLPGCISE